MNYKKLTTEMTKCWLLMWQRLPSIWISADPCRPNRHSWACPRATCVSVMGGTCLCETQCRRHTRRQSGANVDRDLGCWCTCRDPLLLLLPMLLWPCPISFFLSFFAQGIILQRSFSRKKKRHGDRFKLGMDGRCVGEEAMV